MVRRLPSLNGLRAFEAAGRHGSFTAAARELNVTQTAVSRLVRLLEDRLGFALFRRHASALELTAQGQALLLGLTDAFNSIGRLTESVAAMRAGPVLTVGVGPTLAVAWLIPRLANFYRSHPDIEVRVATGGATRAVRDDWTCTIRRDTNALPGHTAEHLFSSAVVPVCTPELASTQLLLSRPTCPTNGHTGLRKRTYSLHCIPPGRCHSRATLWRCRRRWMASESPSLNSLMSAMP